MDVNKSNFAASVSEIVSLIERSAFFAIDLEMTGISSPSLPETPMCSPEETYLAKRDAAKRYNIIQVGLCLFEEVGGGAASCFEPGDAAAAAASSADDLQSTTERPSFLFPKKNASQQLSSSSSSSAAGGKAQQPPLRLVARPFNFFVFPSGAPGGSADLNAVFPARDVTISADAASFLRGHGMDWSRWVNTGVSYCNRIEMIAARDKLWQRREEERAAAPRVAREARAALTDEQKTWLDAATVQAAAFAAEAADKPAGTEWVLPPIRSSASCVALRAAINSDPHLASLLNVSFRGRRHFHDAILVRRALSPEEETQKLITDAVGFSAVFQALLAQRRPIVGHNCFADWCFLMESFFEPLPPTLRHFKQMMRTAAPCVYDTKILANGGCFAGPDEPGLVPPGLFEATHLEGLFRGFGGLRSANVANSNVADQMMLTAPPPSASSPVKNGNVKNLRGGGSVVSNNGGSQSAAAAASSVSLLEISLPLGFTNYDTSAGKSNAAHEAGFDALMTGTVFGHFLTRFAGTPLLDAAENKLALFRSLYAIDLASPASSATSAPTASEPKSGGRADGNFYMPGRHELLHIKHGLGSNSSPVEHALRTAVENVSHFYTLGEGEVLACIGAGPAEDKGDATAPSNATTTTTNAAVQQRQKAVTIAQLNERIAAESASATSATAAASPSAAAVATTAVKKFTDSAALQTLKSMTRTHVLPPHLTWPVEQPPSVGDDADAAAVANADRLSKFVANLQAVPSGAKGHVPPPPAFTLQQFRDRSVRELFRKVTAVRRK